MRCPRPNALTVLCRVAKRKRDDYEPDSLKVMQAAMERYLKSKLYPKSIIRDREFINSEFLTFDEGLTKTRQGGLSVKNRLVTPKMLATGHEERCPVMLFKLYLEKRPKEMKTSSRLYLSVLDKPVSSIWFKKTPMGKNTINTIMKK